MTLDHTEEIAFAAKLIRNAKHLTVFTGAGISTPSGVPDFRSIDTGLWQKQDPMEVASATAFRYHPDRFFAWLHPLLQSSINARPNPAHLAIAELEKAGWIKIVITQNIDGLHQQAGSKKVIELHGSMRSFHCSACHQPGQNPDSIINDILGGLIPRCTYCRALMKPDITLYEEVLPEKAWKNASSEVKKSDVMIIAGSSLEVTPAASLPYDALRNGSRLIIVNYSTTYLDHQADVVFHKDLAQVLPAIALQVLACD